MLLLLVAPAGLLTSSTPTLAEVASRYFFLLLSALLAAKFLSCFARRVLTRGHGISSLSESHASGAPGTARRSGYLMLGLDPSAIGAIVVIVINVALLWRVLGRGRMVRRYVSHEPPL